MKARVKATGEIVDGKAMVSFNGDDFYLDELESLDDDPDYWTRLEHQYAGMAMQGILANSAFDDVSVADIAITSVKLATTLIKRLKEE